MKSITEYELITRTLALENTKFKVYFDKISNKITTVNRFLMVSPTIQSSGHVSGICVLPEREGKVGLMRCYRYQFKEYIWQAPMGFIEPGEAFSESAARELEEETGLTSYEVETLGYTIPDAGVLEAKVALFLSRNCQPNQVSKLTLEPGMGKLSYFDKSKLKQLLLNESEKTSAATAVACYRYLLHS